MARKDGPSGVEGRGTAGSAGGSGRRIAASLIPASAAGRSCARSAALALFFLCILTGIAAGAVQTTLGSTVHLSGISYGGSSVYLFVTGPNLPVEGAALNDIAAGAGQTKVSVDVDGSWGYDWDTHAIPLDAGSYTVWVVDAPVGRTGLAGHDYSTITTVFSRPSVSVVTPAIPGSLEVHAVPENSSVIVAGQYQGMAPITVGDLAPSSYTVTVSHFGYRPITRSVAVEPGSMTVLNVTLAPWTGAVRIVTDPDAARVSLDGREAGISPLTLQDIAVGNHTVVAQRDGYRSVERVVPVLSGQTANVSLTLPAATPVPAATRAGDAISCVVVSAAAGLLAYTGNRRK